MSVAHHVHGFWHRYFAASFRWLHIYLSMVSFVILFFFAATGITLNHVEWFGGAMPHTSLSKGNVNVDWVKTPNAATVARLEIVEQLRKTHGVKGALSDFTVNEMQCMLSFRGPGYTADVTLNRETGAYELTETRMGFVAIINDLHKGRDTGMAWSWLIDASAVLMIFVSITGMTLIFYIKRRRFSGLVAAVVGGLACYLIYRLFVP
jgi:uncharacterized protein